MMNDREKILDKIRAMLRLRDNHAASQGEIENASALIQKLLFKYNLTMGEVESTDADQQYGRFYDVPDQKKRESKWIIRLYQVIAKFNFCTIVIEPKRDNPNDRKHVSYRIAIIGLKQNVEVVTYLCSWLIPKIRLMSAAAWNHSALITTEKRGKFTRGYLLGCVQGIFDKLYTEAVILENESDETRALVRVSDARLEKAVSQFYPKLGQSRAGRLSSQDGRAQGYQAGRQIQLTKGVETRSRKLLGG